MHWKIDPLTERAAIKYPLPIAQTTPPAPFLGRPFHTETWNHHVVQPATWSGQLQSDPDEIRKHFRAARYTQALALVASWGTMWRHPAAIWGWREPDMIEGLLGECAASIRKSESIAGSWEMLRNQLTWSSVLISKTLHFLCLSLDFEQDPPVPIDGAVIREKVWPAFKALIPQRERPGNWEGDTLEAYSRYMTAIITWASQRQWRTPEVERALCLEFNPDWKQSG